MDLLDILPNELKRELLDQVVGFLSRQAEKVAGEQLADKIRKLSSDAAFLDAFDQALKAGTARFLIEYTAVDEDLVAAIAADADFWQSPQVRQALIQLVKRPGAWLVDERETVVQHFEDVLPRRVNRERVDRAVVAYLRCIVEELWTLPGAKEVREVYQLQLEQYSAEALRQQVELQKAQLRTLDNLNAGVREALLQLTDALGKQALAASERTLQLTAPEHTSVRHNLPQPDYGKFVGRDKELADILRVLRPYPHSQIHVVTIDGIGGIGKSTLALEVAHRYLNNFDHLPAEERFGAIIWTSAKQSILTADGIVQRRQVLRNLDDIYRSVATTLQRDDIVRSARDEQPDLIRQALTHQRTLLIIDNLETVDDESVLSFVRELPAPTKAIITTRHRIDVAYPVRLVGMPWDDAHKLIVHEADKKNVRLVEVEQRRLYDRTGGVPLALVWTIAQMGIGHSPEAVLRRLGQATSDIAKFCFENAVTNVRNQPAHYLLMALSLFETDASRESLGEVADLSAVDREDGLVTLEKLSLVNKNGERFQTLPLTRTYSQAELACNSELERQFRDRWLNCLLAILSNLELLYEPRMESVRKEINNIQAAIDYCSQTNQWEKVRDFVLKADPYLWRMGYFGALMIYYQSLIDVAVKQEQPHTQAQFSSRLGNIYEMRGEIDKAYPLVEMAVAIERQYQDDRELVRALYNLSAVQRESGQYDLARQSAKDAIEIASQHNSLRQVVRNTWQLARIDMAEGDFDSADKVLQQALRLTERIAFNRDDSWILTTLYRLLGIVAFNKRDYSSAELYYRQSLEAAQGMSLPHMEARVKRYIAELAYATGDIDRARNMAQDVLALSTRFGMNRETVAMRALLERIN